jgi:hypothetical protein
MLVGAEVLPGSVFSQHLETVQPDLERSAYWLR